MMELVEKNRIKAVVCYRLDRISRSVADFSVMYQKFEDKNVDFFSTSEHYDTSTPSGKAMPVSYTHLDVYKRQPK